MKNIAVQISGYNNAQGFKKNISCTDAELSKLIDRDEIVIKDYRYKLNVIAGGESFYSLKFSKDWKIFTKYISVEWRSTGMERMTLIAISIFVDKKYKMVADVKQQLDLLMSKYIRIQNHELKNVAQLKEQEVFRDFDLSVKPMKHHESAYHTEDANKSCHYYDDPKFVSQLFKNVYAPEIKGEGEVYLFGSTIKYIKPRSETKIIEKITPKIFEKEVTFVFIDDTPRKVKPDDFFVNNKRTDKITLREDSNQLIEVTARGKALEDVDEEYTVEQILKGVKANNEFEINVKRQIFKLTIRCINKSQNSRPVKNLSVFYSINGGKEKEGRPMSSTGQLIIDNLYYGNSVQLKRVEHFDKQIKFEPPNLTKKYIAGEDSFGLLELTEVKPKPKPKPASKVDDFKIPDKIENASLKKVPPTGNPFGGSASGKKKIVIEVHPSNIPNFKLQQVQFIIRVYAGKGKPRTLDRNEYKLTKNTIELNDFVDFSNIKISLPERSKLTIADGSDRKDEQNFYPNDFKHGNNKFTLVEKNTNAGAAATVATDGGKSWLDKANDFLNSKIAMIGFVVLVGIALISIAYNFMLGPNIGELQQIKTNHLSIIDSLVIKKLEKKDTIQILVKDSINSAKNYQNLKNDWKIYDDLSFKFKKDKAGIQSLLRQTNIDEKSNEDSIKTKFAAIKLSIDALINKRDSANVKVDSLTAIYGRITAAEEQAEAAAEGQEDAAKKQADLANAAANREFEGIRGFVYGTLIKENTDNNTKLQKLEDNKQRYLAAGVSRTKYTATLALAKKRVEIRDARVVIDCYRVDESCSDYTQTEYDASVALLVKYYKDKNALYPPQRQEIKTFFQMCGLSKKLQ